MRDPVRWHVVRVPLGVALTVGLLGGATMVRDRGSPAGSAASRAPTERLHARFTTLPVSFEPNVGQAALPVRFLARGRGHRWPINWARTGGPRWPRVSSYGAAT